MYVGHHAEYSYSCYVLMNLELSRHIFEKYFSNFMTIRLVAGDLFHWDERTDRYDETYSRFSLFCESAQKEKQILEYVQFYFQAFYISPWHQCDIFMSCHLISTKEMGYTHKTGPRILKRRDQVDTQNCIISDLREVCFEYVNWSGCFEHSDTSSNFIYRGEYVSASSC